MTRLYLIIAVIAYSYCADSQTTFNLRLRYDFPAAVLTGIIPTDSCYYATGIIADSVFPYNTGSIFMKLDLEGQPLLVKTLRSTQKTYETWFDNLVRLPDGSFAVQAYSVDSTEKTMIIKFTQEGDTIFTKEYLNPGFPAFDFIQPRGGFASMPDGGFVIANAINTPGNSSNVDLYLIKTDHLGNKEWGKVYSNPMWDRPESLLVTPEGKIIVGAIRTNDNTAVENYTYRCHIFQVDSLGNVEWDYLSPPGTTLRDAANDMVLLEDGSLVVASGVGHEQERPSVNVVYFDKYIFKLNPQHQLEWELTFKDTVLTGSSGTTNVIKLSDESGYILVGIDAAGATVPNYFASQGWLAKVSATGDSIWVRKFIGVNSNNSRHRIYDIKETPDGGFILCGESRDLEADSFPQQAWLLKLDSYGCLVPGCQLTDAAEEAGAEPALQLAIYPNPAADYLNFYLRGPVQGREPSFRIVSAAGQVVRTFPGSGPGMTYIVPVWDWAPGVYFLQYVEEGVVRASERFVKR